MSQNQNVVSKTKIIQQTVLLVFWVLLLAIEIACSQLAWETVGEIESGFLGFLICLNVVPFVIYFFQSKVARKIAVGLALLLAALIIPRQLLLRYRWHLLQQEASNLIKYAKENKSRTGAYPRDLTAYHFLYPNLKPHITYSAFKSLRCHTTANGDIVADKIATIPDFGISLFIETPTTPHLYTASGGYTEMIDDWWYYPD